jgi:cytochrome P450
MTTSLPPGRSGLPLIGETFAFLQSSGPFVLERAARFGPVFRTHLFGKPTAVLVGAEANRFILTDGMANLTWKDGWPPTFGALLGEALFLQDGETHRYKRNLLMPAFHSEALAGYTKVMHERLEANLSRWEELGQFAWHKEFRRLTFEVASILFLGSGLGPASSELTQLMDEWTAGLFAAPIRLPFTTFGKALRARDRLLAYVELAVRHRMENPTRDALGLLVASRDEAGNQLTIEELRSQALFLVAAGHDTTTSMLTSTAQLLALHPEVRERARAEQDALAIDGPLDLNHLRQMTYLEQVMREVERIHPPAGFGFRGVVEPFEFGGYEIPKGWQVVFSIEATHLDPQHFPEPERFNPDRWAGSTRAEPEQRNSFQLVGFGGGPRICIGMAVAKTQLKIIFSHLLRGYDWELEAGQDLSVKMLPSRCPRSGLLVRFRRRR